MPWNFSICIFLKHYLSAFKRHIIKTFLKPLEATSQSVTREKTKKTFLF